MLFSSPLIHLCGFSLGMFSPPSIVFGVAIKSGPSSSSQPGSSQGGLAGSDVPPLPDEGDLTKIDTRAKEGHLQSEEAVRRFMDTLFLNHNNYNEAYGEGFRVALDLEGDLSGEKSMSLIQLAYRSAWTNDLRFGIVDVVELRNEARNVLLRRQEHLRQEHPRQEPCREDASTRTPSTSSSTRTGDEKSFDDSDEGQSDGEISEGSITDYVTHVFWRTGLMRLLQDSAIQKLMWDCRKDSEALRKMYGVRLRGVFDLQIYRVFLYDKGKEDRLRTSWSPDGSKLLSGLGSILVNDLGSWSHDWYQLMLKVSAAKKQESHDRWYKRPLDPAQLRYAAQDVWLLLYLADSYDLWVFTESVWLRYDPIQRNRIKWSQWEGPPGVNIMKMEVLAKSESRVRTATDVRATDADCGVVIEGHIQEFSTAPEDTTTYWIRLWMRMNVEGCNRPDW